MMVLRAGNVIDALRNVDRVIGQRRTTDAPEVHVHDPVLARTKRARDARGGADLGLVTLPIRHRQRVTLRPDSRASASTVAELPHSSNHCAIRSLSWNIAPEHFVKLHLETNRQAVRENPVGQVARGQLFGAGREQHRHARPVSGSRVCRGSTRSRRDRRSRT